MDLTSIRFGILKSIGLLNGINMRLMDSEKIDWVSNKDNSKSINDLKDWIDFLHNEIVNTCGMPKEIMNTCDTPFVENLTIKEKITKIFHKILNFLKNHNIIKN